MSRVRISRFILCLIVSFLVVATPLDYMSRLPSDKVYQYNKIIQDMKNLNPDILPFKNVSINDRNNKLGIELTIKQLIGGFAVGEVFTSAAVLMQYYDNSTDSLFIKNRINNVRILCEDLNKFGLTEEAKFIERIYITDKKELSEIFFIRLVDEARSISKAIGREKLRLSLIKFITYISQMLAVTIISLLVFKRELPLFE